MLPQQNVAYPDQYFKMGPHSFDILSIPLPRHTHVVLHFNTLTNWFSYGLRLILSLGATETKPDLFLHYCLPKGPIWIVVRKAVSDEGCHFPAFEGSCSSGLSNLLESGGDRMQCHQQAGNMLTWFLLVYLARLLIVSKEISRLMLSIWNC